MLNFFEAGERALQYLIIHPEVTGHAITLPEAYSRRSEMPTAIERDQVQQLLEQGAQLVEVLPEDEYADERLPGAINLPLKTIDAESARRLERERPVIVYCYDYQ